MRKEQTKHENILRIIFTSLGKRKWEKKRMERMRGREREKERKKNESSSTQERIARIHERFSRSLSTRLHIIIKYAVPIRRLYPRHRRYLRRYST